MKKKEDQLVSKPKGLSEEDWWMTVRALSLEDWLAAIRRSDSTRKKHQVPDYCFLTDAHREQYLSSIHERNEEDVRDLIRRFLVPEVGLESDSAKAEWLAMQPNASELIKKKEFYRRLLRWNGPWEGLTWILDLLPDDALKALGAVDAFLSAHILHLPDGRIHGLSDVLAIIRAKYLECDNPRDALLSLAPRDFEFLVAAAYRRLGYDVRLTSYSRDGGFDVEVRRSEAGRAEISLVECKKYQGAVRVAMLRALWGVVEEKGANRGVLVTTGQVTGPARELAASTARLDVVGYPDLNRMLNKAFGSNWPRRVDRQIWWMKKDLSESAMGAFLPGRKGVS